MKRVAIDCSAIANRAELHAALAEGLAFPAWYGANLDALHDLLTAIGEDTTLLLLSWTDAEGRLGPYGTRAEKVLAMSSLENPYLTVEFC